MELVLRHAGPRRASVVGRALEQYKPQSELASPADVRACLELADRLGRQEAIADRLERRTSRTASMRTRVPSAPTLHLSRLRGRLPQLAALVDRLVEEMRPVVEQYRLRVFGHHTPPFRRLQDALEWVTEIVSKDPPRLIHSSPSAVFARGHAMMVRSPGEWMEGREFQPGTPPASLKELVSHLANETGLWEVAIVGHVLYGERPHEPEPELAFTAWSVVVSREPPPVGSRPRVEYVRRAVTIHLAAQHVRPDLFRALCTDIRAEFRRQEEHEQQTRAEDARESLDEALPPREGGPRQGNRRGPYGLSSRNRSLLDVVRSLFDHPPPVGGKGSKLAWGAVHKEWRRRRLKPEYLTWRALLKQYQRLSKRYPEEVE